MYNYITYENKMMIFDYNTYVNMENITHLIIFNITKKIEYLPNSLEYLKVYHLTEHLINLPPALDELILLYPTSKIINQDVPYGCRLIFSSPTKNATIEYN
jgi:hypothetical protein